MQPAALPRPITLATLLSVLQLLDAAVGMLYLHSRPSPIIHRCAVVGKSDAFGHCIGVTVRSVRACVRAAVRVGPSFCSLERPVGSR